MTSTKKPLRILTNCILATLFLLAIILRISLYHIESTDYIRSLSPWYDFIQTHHGLAALKYNFSNYNIPYLSLLALTSYLPIPKLIAIKTISVVFDGMLAICAYLIVSQKYKRSYLAIVAALVTVFIPTVVINSAAWAQSDAIYTAFCLGSLYFLLKERPAWACIFFALALSFKLQAIFFLPVLLVLALRRKLPVRHFFLIPVIFLLMLTPALIAGRNIWSLLNIYVEQASTGGIKGNPSWLNRGPTPFSFLTRNAPSFYQWFPANASPDWKWLGIALAALFVILIAILVMKSKQPLTSALLIKITLVFALALPFLLPEMHERYFYLADVISVIYAFYFPRYFFIAIIMQLSSLLSYAPFLLHVQIVNLAYVAIAVLVITLIALFDLVLSLYPNTQSYLRLPNKSKRNTASTREPINIGINNDGAQR